ncbi:MAG: hypothetical protein NTY87_11015 [Planctomycetia bacterium]|nr:hypothetical protein [Planctomycetia bacterium]
MNLGALGSEKLIVPIFTLEMTVRMTMNRNDRSDYWSPRFLTSPNLSVIPAMLKRLKQTIRRLIPVVVFWASIICLTAGGVLQDMVFVHAKEPNIAPVAFSESEQIESPIETLEMPTKIVEDVLPEQMILADDEPSGDEENGDINGDTMLLDSIEQVVPSQIVNVSSRAADGLKIQDFGFDEMPSEASSGAWFSNGSWYGSAESVWFGRSRSYRRVLGHDTTVPVPGGRDKSTGTFITSGIPFDLAPGGRMTLGKYIGRDYLDRDQSVEMTFYGGLFFTQNDAWNAIPNSFLVTPLAPEVPGFNGAQTFYTSLNSSYNSMEWNYKLRRRLGRDQLVMSPNGNWSKHAERGFLASLMIGGRIANVNENFSFISRRNSVFPATFGGDYNIHTQNWLLGMNIGSEVLSQNEFYYWGVRGRVTPAMNFGANQQSVVSANTALPAPLPKTENRAGSASQLSPAFIGDLTLFAGWNVTPNFSFKAGYDFLWVAGVATAERQINLNNIRQNPIDNGGQFLCNGVSFGCEGSW